MYSANMTFERHLDELTRQYPEYENLYASWKILRRVLSSALENVVLYFPHYTQHDASHSHAILVNLERFLGDDCVQSFSPTDTWMMLVSAYAHDIGMILHYDDVKSAWKSKEFKEFLEKTVDDDDRVLQEYAEDVLESAANSPDGCVFAKLWKIIVLTAEFFRKKHAQSGSDTVRGKTKKCLDIDFSATGLIPTRIVSVLGNIVKLHEDDFQHVLNKLEYEVNGFGADFLHPRCIAVLLRIGDLLDLDNGRSSDNKRALLGPLPDKTVTNIKRHHAISNFLAKEGRILIMADCDEYETYDTLRIWCNYLVSDIKNTCLYSNEIMPREYEVKFSFPDIVLKLNGQVMKESDLYSFHVPVDDVMKLIQGNSIYRSDYTFFREFIINAIDASKLRFWKMVELGEYPAVKQSESEIYLPNIVTPEIAEKFAVEVDIACTNDENRGSYFTISILDHGVGIDGDSIRDMARPTKSWRDRDKWKTFIERMPKWLQPSGEFGIGLHSAFMYVNQISCISHSMNGGLKKIIFNERNSDHKIVFYSVIDDKSDIGTNFCIEIPEKLCQIPEKDTKILLRLDNPKLEKILYMEAWIRATVAPQIFPIKIKWSCEDIKGESVIEARQYKNIYVREHELQENRYYIKVNWNKLTVFVYDVIDCIDFDFTFNFSPTKILKDEKYNIYFRGGVLAEIYNRYRLYGDLNVSFDGYGAREYLLISRDHILDKKRQEIFSSIDHLMTVGIRYFFAQQDFRNEKCEKILLSQGWGEFAWERLADLYDIFQIKNIDRGGEIHAFILKHIQETRISCWKKEEGSFRESNIRLSEFRQKLWDNQDMWFVCEENSMGIVIACSDILGCLNSEDCRNVMDDVDIIFQSRKYTNLFLSNHIKEYKNIAADMYLVSCNIACTSGIELLDDASREELIYRRMIKEPYCVMPGLQEYQALLIVLPQTDYQAYGENRRKWMLSPLGEKRCKVLEQDKTVPIDMLKDEEFKRLVQYVREHNVNNAVTENDITEAYRELIEDFNRYLHVKFSSKHNDLQ